MNQFQAALCNNNNLINNLVAVSREMGFTHTRCLEILCNLTRFPRNNAKLVRKSDLIECLVNCGKSTFEEDRVWSMRAFQNLTSDASSWTTLATAHVLEILSVSATRKGNEQQAAVGAFFNLSIESAAIIPLTNTKNIVATLVYLAHNPDSSEEICKMACNVLVNISLWFQVFAGIGTVPDRVEPVPLPSQISTGWMRWDQ